VVIELSEGILGGVVSDTYEEEEKKMWGSFLGPNLSKENGTQEAHSGH